MSADNITVTGVTRISLWLRTFAYKQEYKKNNNWMRYVGKTKPCRPFIITNRNGITEAAYYDAFNKLQWLPFIYDTPSEYFPYILAWGCTLRFEP